MSRRPEPTGRLELRGHVVAEPGLSALGVPSGAGPRPLPAQGQPGAGTARGSPFLNHVSEGFLSRKLFEELDHSAAVFFFKRMWWSGSRCRRGRKRARHRSRGAGLSCTCRSAVLPWNFLFFFFNFRFFFFFTLLCVQSEWPNIESHSDR